MKKKVISLFLFTASLLAMNHGTFAWTDIIKKNDQNSSLDYQQPDIDDIHTDVDNKFSNAVNTLFNAKEIKMDKFSLTLYPNYSDKTDSILIQLSNLDIDLANLNTLCLNFYCNARIFYKGFDETLTLEYKADDCLYVSHKKGNSFKCSLPETLNDVFLLLKSFGIGINLNDSFKNVSLISILNYIKDSKSEIEQNNSSDSGYVYSLSLKEIQKENLKLNNSKLYLYADDENNPKGIKTKEDILLSTNKDSFGISFDGTFDQVLQISTYSNRFTDVSDITDNVNSIFTTLTDLFSGNYSDDKKKKFNINIDGTISKKVNEDLISLSSLEGVLQADINNVFENEDMGEYALSLSQTANNNQKTLNDISLYYNKNNLYLSLNDIFKGKISDTKLKNTFETISKITDKLAFKEIDKNLNLIFNIAKQSDLSKLIHGDFSIISSLLKNYQFSENSLSLSFDKDIVGLEKDFTLSLNFKEENEHKILNDISLDVLSLKEIEIQNLSFAIDNYQSILKPNENEYSSFDKSLNLFDSLSDIIGSKIVSADYNLIFTDQQNVTFNANGSIHGDVSNATIDINEDNKVLHTNEGNYYLSFLLPQEKNTKEILGQGIEMYYSGQDKNLYFGFQYDQNPNFSSLKDDSYFVFKNSLAYSDIQGMLDLIDTKVEDSSNSTSNSISTMSDLVSAISNSEKFKNLKHDLDHYVSFKELDGVLSIGTDEEDNLLLSLDPSAFLKDTIYKDNTSKILLAISSDSNIVELSCEGKIDGCQISFDLSLNDKVKDFSKFNTVDYPVIKDSQALLSSFVSLPTDLETFDLTLSGKMQEEGKDVPSLLIEDTSGFSVSTKGNTSLSGIVNIKHPDLNDSSKLIDGSQKLEFNYQSLDETYLDKNSSEKKNGEILLEYNDKMHVKLKNNDIFDVMNILTSVNSSDNLLYRYLKFLNSTVESSGSPLMDILNGKAISTSGIFAYPYFKKIAFEEGVVILDINPKLIQSGVDEQSDARISIYYDTIEKKIKSASIQAKIIQDGVTNNIEAAIGLNPTADGKFKRTETTDTSDTETDKNILSYNDSTSKNFVDIYGFKVLLQCTINTTENNFLEIQGDLSVKLNLFSISVNANAYACIYVKDETATAYLRINAGNKSATDNDYCVSEFFIKEQEVYVNQTKCSTSTEWEGFKRVTYCTLSSTSYKTDSKNITDNLAYYILDFSLNLRSITFGGLALKEIYKAMNDSESSSTTVKSDFSQAINADKTSYTESNKTFVLDLNLDSFLEINLVKIPTLRLTISHKDDMTLSNVKIDAKMTVVSILSVSITSSDTVNNFRLTRLQNINAAEAKETYLKRYHDFVTQFDLDHSNASLYRILKISNDGNLTTEGDSFTKSHKNKKDNILDEVKDDIYIYVA